MIFFLSSCSGFNEAGKILRNEKVSTNDEFLVRKKEPLILPPDYKKMPVPDSVLKENNEKEKTLDNKKTKQIKKISKSKEGEIETKIELNGNSKDKSTKKTIENNEVVFLDKKDDIELIDDINNARKKRRRSSASIE